MKAGLRPEVTTGALRTAHEYLQLRLLGAWSNPISGTIFRPSRKRCKSWSIVPRDLAAAQLKKSARARHLRPFHDKYRSISPTHSPRSAFRASQAARRRGKPPVARGLRLISSPPIIGSGPGRRKGRERSGGDDVRSNRTTYFLITRSNAHALHPPMADRRLLRNYGGGRPTTHAQDPKKPAQPPSGPGNAAVITPDEDDGKRTQLYDARRLQGVPRRR